MERLARSITRGAGRKFHVATAIIAIASRIATCPTATATSDDSQIERLQVQLELEIEWRTRAEDTLETVKKELHTFETTWREYSHQAIAPRIATCPTAAAAVTSNDSQIERLQVQLELEIEWRTRAEDTLETVEKELHTFETTWREYSHQAIARHGNGTWTRSKKVKTLALKWN
jgi:chromosome segregation ATPase